MKTACRILLIATVMCSASLGLFALVTEDPPDSEVNPRTNEIETADAVSNDGNQDIRYVIDAGIGSSPNTFTISDNPLDDRRPRVAIAADGNAWVVWWRDDSTDKVLVRKKTFSSGSWSNERTVSDTSEGSRNPVVIHDGTDAWVAYEYDDQGDIGIGVSMIVDEPVPLGLRYSAATSSFAGDLGLLIHAESSNLWMSWVDSSSEVGWTEYDYTSETWALPSYESYTNDTATDARSRIRTAVLEE